jgi:hypothetical protein
MKAMLRKMYGVGVFHRLGGPPPPISFTETPSPLSGLILSLALSFSNYV